MSVDILGTNCDQCVSMVQCCFTSTETIRLVRTGSPGRPPRLSHLFWTLSHVPSLRRALYPFPHVPFPTKSTIPLPSRPFPYEEHYTHYLTSLSYEEHYTSPLTSLSLRRALYPFPHVLSLRRALYPSRPFPTKSAIPLTSFPYEEHYTPPLTSFPPLRALPSCPPGRPPLATVSGEVGLILSAHTDLATLSLPLTRAAESLAMSSGYMTVTPAAFSAGVFSPSVDSFNLVCVLSPLRRSLHTESFEEDYRYGDFGED